MKRLVILCTVTLLVLLSVVSVIGCQQEAESPPLKPATEYLTYTNAEYGFSIDYPEDWDVMEDYMGTAVAFMGPLVLEDSYYLNISVVVEQLPEEMTLKDYVKALDLNLKRTTPDYNKVEEYSTTISGLPATVLVATATTALDGEDIALRDTLAMFIKDEVAYTITYNAPEEFHDEYAEYFDLVISSFKFD